MVEEGVRPKELIVDMWKEMSKDYEWIKDALRKESLVHVFCRLPYCDMLKSYYVPICPVSCECKMGDGEQAHEHWIGYKVASRTNTMARKELESPPNSWKAKTINDINHLLNVIFYLQSRGAGGSGHYHCNQVFSPALTSKTVWYSKLLRDTIEQDNGLLNDFSCMLTDAYIEAELYKMKKQKRKADVNVYFANKVVQE